MRGGNEIPYQRKNIFLIKYISLPVYGENMNLTIQTHNGKITRICDKNTKTLFLYNYTDDRIS